MAADDRSAARLAMLVSFTSFFVFPAIPIGRTAALTVPVVLSAALVAASLPRLRTAEWAPYAWMLAPVVISGAWILLVGSALVPDVVAKSIAALAMAFLVVVPAGRLLRSGHGDAFVLGAACAILVHAALGAYQVVAFDRGDFPFAELMRTNPAMSLLTEDTRTYVEWVKRPFGLFAEPSAMAACLGPWLVLVTSALFTPRREGSRLRTAVLALALGGGLALVVASKSGMAASIVGGTAVTALAAAFSGRRSVVTRVAALGACAAIALASVSWLSENARSRFDLVQNDSWQGRFESLKLAVRSLGSSSYYGGGLVVGIGPGQSYPAVNTTQLRYEAGGGVSAVWSVGLNYAMETGLLGIVAMLALAGYAACSIWSSRARVAGVAFAFVWLTGVVVGTSYAGQPALWTGLAALLSWPWVTEAREEAQGTIAPSALEAWKT